MCASGGGGHDLNHVALHKDIILNHAQTEDSHIC